MSDYVLVASGLPKMSGVDKVEEELTGFFERGFSSVGTKVVGVSVCWDYRKFDSEVDEQTRFELDKLQREWEKIHQADGLRNEEYDKDQLSPRKSPKRSSITMLAPAPEGGSGSSTPRSPKPSKQTPVPLITVQGEKVSMPMQDGLRSLDAILGVSVDTESDSIGPEDRGDQEVLAMIQTIRCSGDAYIVFASETQRNKALEYAKANSDEFVFRDSKVSFQEVDCEPETVLWRSYGNRPGDVLFNMIIGVIIIILAIVLLDIFFYFPSVAYFVSMANVRGMTQGGLGQGTILGLLVTVCNAIIYCVIGKVTDGIGFNTVGRHQRFYVVCYTFAVFINTVIDLGVVMLLAQGFTMDQAMQTGIPDDSTMSTKAMVESPSLQRSIYIQYVAYIFPSCLLLPYLIEPVVNYILFILTTWVIRSREDVCVQLAEDVLTCPPFDLSRYGDILINIMLCLGALAFTYRDLWWIFGCLTLSLIWLYVLDSWRMLRGTCRSVFVSMKMDITAQWLAAFPCAILAGALVFRAYGHAKTDAWDDVLRKIDHLTGSKKNVQHVSELVGKEVVVVLIIAAFFVHLLIHFVILSRLVPQRSSTDEHGDETVPYEETATNSPCNWFNSNPMHCLRSKYLYKHETSCIKFVAGRACLLKRNPDLGLYFEEELTVDEEGGFSSVLAGIKESQSYKEFGLKSLCCPCLYKEAKCAEDDQNEQKGPVDLENEKKRDIWL
jgi:hypothetical protein